MSGSVFAEMDLWALVACSIVLPVWIYVFLLRKGAISRKTVLVLGILFIFIAGIDIFLLQRLMAMARSSVSSLDDLIFSSELSVALYLLPGLFAGIGVNMVSHVLVSHLAVAEKRFERVHE